MNPIYEKAYFFSDSHLHIELSNQELLKRSRMISFLDKVKDDNSMLCIVGDLFDFWFEYKYALLRAYFDILFKLRELILSGIQVHYIAGNHDLWLNSFFEKSIGVKVYPDCFSTQIGTKKIFVKHGDGVLKRDKGYRILKKVLKNKYCISLYRLIHPDFGVPIAHFFSRKSRVYTSEKIFAGDLDYREFAQTRINEGYDYVIMGHTHHPLIERLNGGCYINTGNWINEFSYVTIDQKGPRLLYWDNPAK